MLLCGCTLTVSGNQINARGNSNYNDFKVTVPFGSILKLGYRLHLSFGIYVYVSLRKMTAK